MVIDYNILTDGQESLTNPVDVFVQAFQMLLNTEENDILYWPECGLNLKEFLYNTNVRNVDIRNEITQQVDMYARTTGAKFSIDDIKIVELPDGDDCIFIEYTINDEKSVIKIVK